MSMRKRKKVQILSREELMLRRWDFRLVPSERSLEAVGESVRLHIISRSKVFDLFPRTYKGKNRCVSRRKHALINSRERPLKSDINLEQSSHLLILIKPKQLDRISEQTIPFSEVQKDTIIILPLFWGRRSKRSARSTTRPADGLC